MSLSAAWTLLKRTVSEWSDDHVSRLSASLAFYTVFSVAPLLLIVVVIGSVFFGKEATSQRVSMQLHQQLGPAAANGIERLMKTAYTHSNSSTAATIAGIIVLLYAATNTFSELLDAMNQIWDVKPKPGRFWWGLIKTRLFAFAMVLVVGLLLLVSFLLSTAMAAITQFLHIPTGWQVAGHGVSFIISILLFATIYKFLPDVKLRWADVWIGASITAILFSVGKFLVAFYLTRSGASSLYGAAGSLAVLLLWIYYSAQVFFIGAEITQILADDNSHVQPTDNAIRGTGHETRDAPHHSDAARLHSRTLHLHHVGGAMLVAVGCGFLAGWWYGREKRALPIKLPSDDLTHVPPDPRNGDLSGESNDMKFPSSDVSKRAV